MNATTGRRLALLLCAAAGAALAPAAAAQTVLRLDEVAVGELDPGKASDYADSILMFNAYDTLVIPARGEAGMAPHLAESWEIDGERYTFTLRDDVTFQSGNPLTAEDVVFSFDRMVALGQGLSYLFADRVRSVEALDGRTVRFTLDGPYAPFLSSLARLPIVDRALVMDNLADGEGEMGDWGQAFLSANAAGSGAYRVVRHNPQDETLFEKNPDYFLPIAEAAPDEVRMRYGLEASTVRALIARGEHDISSQWIPPEVARAIAEEGGQLLREPSAGGFYIKMNTTKPPLDDVHCRRALAAAFDYATLLRMVEVSDTVAAGTPSHGALAAGMLGGRGPAMARDTAAAREHLEQCAHDPAEHTLEVSWIAEVPIEERFALLAQATFTELGFGAEITRMPWALFTEAVATPETTPHFSQLFNSAMTGDPDTLLWGMYHSSARGTWQSPEYLADDEVDRLLEEGRTETDPAARADLYAALDDRLIELAPTIFGFDRQTVFAASDRVRAPALSGDPAAGYALDGFGFNFRFIEVAD